MQGGTVGGGLTVAIPTMRRWTGFLEKSLPIYLGHPLIRTVLVCDETGEDISAIQKSRWAGHAKLILHSNPKRLGAYLNKRQCIELAPTEWIAVLDSDNFFPETFFDTLEDIWQSEGHPNPKYFYGSGQIERIFVKTGQSENRTAHFAGMKIDRRLWNNILKMSLWPFMLNDGNWIVHRSVLSVLPPDIPDKQTRATDAIFSTRKMVAGGWTYWVHPDLRYFHMVHDDSEWLKTESESSYLLGSTDWRIQN